MGCRDHSAKPLKTAEAIEMKEETIKGGLENRTLGSTVGAMGSGNTVAAAQTPIRAHRGVGFVNRTRRAYRQEQGACRE
ncbi:unnamed protein product [Boreogadus saida]